MPTRVAAIDVTSRVARFVIVESSLRQSEVIRAGRLEREEEDDDQSFRVRLRDEIGDSVDSVVVLADAGVASTRLLSFPFKDLRKVEQSLEFELESLVPYDWEDLAVTWHVVERGSDHSQVLAAVTPKDRFAARLEGLADAGLEPRAVVLPGAALAELVDSNVEEPVALVSLGATQCHVSIVLRGVRYTRTLRTGGDVLDRMISRRFNVTVEQARAAKETEARILPPDEPATEQLQSVSTALMEGLQPLVSSLAATFKSLPDDYRPARILLTGGLSRLGGLPQFLQSRLGIDVALLDIQAALGNVQSHVTLGPEYALAAGLALGTTRHGSAVPMNLRRGDFAYVGDMQLYRGELKRVGFGIAAIILLALAGSIVRYAMISSQEDEIRQGFCDATKRIVGREICDPLIAIDVLKNPGSGTGLIIPDYTAADLYETMSKAIGKDLDVSVSTLDIRLNPTDPDRITGQGEAANFETIEKLTATLQQDACVTGAETTKQERTRDSSRVKFNFNVKLDCPPGVLPGSKLEVVAAGASPTGGAPKDPNPTSPTAAPAAPTPMPASAPARGTPPSLPGNKLVDGPTMGTQASPSLRPMEELRPLPSPRLRHGKPGVSPVPRAGKNSDAAKR